MHIYDCQSRSANITMPCETCGKNLLTYGNEKICPKCKRLAVLDPITAIKVVERIVGYARTLLSDEIRHWVSNILLGNLAADREYFARRFFAKYSELDIGSIAAYTLLIKQVAELGIIGGKTPKDRQDTSNLLSNFQKLLELETELLKVKSCQSKVLYLDHFDEERITPDQFSLLMAQNLN